MDRSPRIAFIILAHRYPQLLRRIIERLHYKEWGFFVHVDSKSDIAPFQRELNGLNASITWLTREDGRWGGFGIVQATLNGLQAVLQSDCEYDHTVLLSGQTYPIKPTQQIAEFFKQHHGQSILHYHGVPDSSWADTNDGLDRIERYHFMFRGWPRVHPPLRKPTTPKEYLLQQLFAVRFPAKRRFPGGFVPYGGSQWWCLSHDVVEYVVDFCSRNRNFVKYHRYTLLADEIFFHSIILNAPNQRFQTEIVNDFSVYMDWSLGYCKTLGMDDFQRIADSAMLFARKFDETVSAEVLDKIDSVLLADQHAGR